MCPPHKLVLTEIYMVGAVTVEKSVCDHCGHVQTTNLYPKKP